MTYLAYTDAAADLITAAEERAEALSLAALSAQDRAHAARRAARRARYGKPGHARAIRRQAAAVRVESVAMKAAEEARNAAFRMRMAHGLSW